MLRRIGWWLPGLVLLLLAVPAEAHNLPAAEVARLNLLVTRALDGGWAGILLLMASGVALGALHGLEPGHAKTMMSAFIIAIRGTVGQAVLLGAAATVSHTAIVWLLVVPLLAWGGSVDLAGNEPYFQIASAVAVLLVAGWTLLRLLRAGRAAPAVVAGDVAPATAPVIDTGHGLARLEIAEVDGQPHFVVRGVARSGRTMPFHEDVTVRTRGPDGATATFAFAPRAGALVSLTPVPAPHRFIASLGIAHDDHAHEFPVVFAPPGEAPMRADAAEAEDAHARAHAEALRRQLAAGRPMTRWQIVLFGLSGGLLPCPAAVTVLLLCLHLGRIGLGVLLVSSFSLGLALTMIAAGALAAVGANQLGRRWGGFAALARPATFASCALILGIGLYMLAQGIDALA